MEPAIIQNKIYYIRGQRVMLDFDLAEMYQVETRILNQAVKRNIKRYSIKSKYKKICTQITPIHQIITDCNMEGSNLRIGLGLQIPL